jgi:hypothetical protein
MISTKENEKTQLFMIAVYIQTLPGTFVLGPASGSVLASPSACPRQTGQVREFLSDKQWLD